MPARRNAFVLIIVLAIIAVLGASMAVLSDATHTMVYETHRMSCDAQQRNLQLSARRWAARRLAQKGGDLPAGAIELDVKQLEVPSGKLKVTFVKSAKPGQVEVETTCRRGPRTITRRERCQVNR